MSRAMLRRITRLEAMQATPEPVTIEVQVKDGRQPFRVYDGERLKADAWPGHLLVPAAGIRPSHEPLPYCLERG